MSEQGQQQRRTGTIDLTEYQRNPETIITDHDMYLFNEGNHFRLYQKLGAHPMHGLNQPATSFAVWAPNARQVSVIGEFNGWDPGAHPLTPLGSSGIWQGIVPGIGPGTLYKYHIASQFNDYQVDKADPFAFFTEVPPKTASIVWELDYEWGDQDWMAGRYQRNALNAPISIYEVHIGSWMRVPEEGYRSLSYRELAPRLAALAAPGARLCLSGILAEQAAAVAAAYRPWFELAPPLLRESWARLTGTRRR